MIQRFIRKILKAIPHSIDDFFDSDKGEYKSQIGDNLLTLRIEVATVWPGDNQKLLDSILQDIEKEVSEEYDECVIKKFMVFSQPGKKFKGRRMRIYIPETL